MSHGTNRVFSGRLAGKYVVTGAVTTYFHQYLVAGWRANMWSRVNMWSRAPVTTYFPRDSVGDSPGPELTELTD